MFAFFSNRLGCLGSIVVSVIGTLILLAVLRSSRKHVRESDERSRDTFRRFIRSGFIRESDMP